MRIPLGLSYGLRCGDSMKRRDIAEEEKDDFSKILHGPKKPLNYFYRKSQIKYSYHGAFTEKPVDKTILVEAMVLRLDHIGFLDRSNNNYSWKSLFLVFIFTVPWCSGS
ncbi:hypothetical protein NC651_022436 [Populus alba x Populus x berolinensis]|nr:hypothetical protein NC651_022436 [Populus alba x Populus x berolinensis]